MKYLNLYRHIQKLLNKKFHMRWNMKEKIIYLYYIEKKLCKDIAIELNISTSTVTRTIKKDSRYNLEKENRKKTNKANHNKEIQKRVDNKRKQMQFKNNNDDLILREIHIQDSMELSDRKYLSNENYRKWNYSAYKYNPSKKRYEFREELGRSNDVPKYIKERC